MGRSARWLSVVVLALTVGMVPGAGAASAHSGKSIVRLAVTADHGTTLVSAFLVYANDWQPVRDEFVLAVVSSEGTSRSFQLRPDDRVAGVFASRVHLSPGQWTLSVSANAATVGSATGGFTVGDTGRLTGIGFSSSFDPSTVSERTNAGSSRTRDDALLVVGGAFLVLLIALSVKLRATRRAGTSPEEDAPEPSFVL